MKIAINTGGGDAPGLNAVIRAVVLSATKLGWSVYGIRRGYQGLFEEDGVVALTRDAVRGITHLGGTILGTTNRGNPLSWPVEREDGTVELLDRSEEVVEEFRRRELDALIPIGGDRSSAYRAIHPAVRPMSSTTMTRLCASAVECSRPIASVAVATAVWKPKVTWVVARSLSMVFGTPTTGRPFSDKVEAI